MYLVLCQKCKLHINIIMMTIRLDIHNTQAKLPNTVYNVVLRRHHHCRSKPKSSLRQYYGVIEGIKHYTCIEYYQQQQREDQE